MRRIACLALLVFVAACGDDGDHAAPPSPRIGAVASPTAATRILITGTAEFGATIEMTGAVFDPPTITADPFTAEFRVIATLAPNTTNTLSFVAIDEAGNRSEPTTLAIEHSDGFGIGDVAVSNVRVNGVVCVLGGAPLACPVSPGDFVEFDVGTTNFIPVSLGYSAWFQQANSLRSLNVYIGANATSMAQHFQFTVPGGFFEDVALVAHGVDGSGNEYTSAMFTMRVSIFTGGRPIDLIAAGGLLNSPNDVGLDAAGNVFVANDGDANVLRVPSGSQFPAVFSSYARGSSFLAVAGNGDLYVTDNDVYRVSADGASVTHYAGNTPGSAQGVNAVAATKAKAIVDASGSVDNATLVVGLTTYELDTNASCAATATHVCVNTNGVANPNLPLAPAIDASAEVDAAYDAGSDTIVIAATVAGESGNGRTLTSNGITRVTPAFSQGHDEEVFVGADGDQFVYRLPENLPPTADLVAANHGAFDVLDPQLGLAVRYASTPASYDVLDAYFYFVDDGARDRLRARRHVATNGVGVTTTTFSTTNGGQFNALYDVAQAPNGCLLVSDEGNGDIYSVDARVITNMNPTIALVASGFDRPRGLAFHGTDLYVVDRNLDAVVRISPLAGSCF